MLKLRSIVPAINLKKKQHQETAALFVYLTSLTSVYSVYSCFTAYAANVNSEKENTVRGHGRA